MTAILSIGFQTVKPGKVKLPAGAPGVMQRTLLQHHGLLIGKFV
jgi:hypothetical protein